MAKSIFKNLFKGLFKSSRKPRRQTTLWKNSSGGSVFGVDKRTKGGKMAWLNPGRTEGRRRKR